MIILSEVAQKIEEILNDSSNPASFDYQVETEGFHIDHIKKENKTGNFIPVFIHPIGGQFNPVKGLKQGSYSLQIAFWFPVRFKENFYALSEYLVDTFVGTYLNYGTISGSAVSNINWPQFGEIESLDFEQFIQWHNTVYKRPIEKREPYMSMVLELYLNNAASGLIFGNNIQTNFSFTYDGHTYTLEDINYDGGSLQSNSQAQSEQEEGQGESTSIPFGTTYASAIKVYPNLEVLAKESPATPTQGNPAIYFYQELLKVWFSGNIQDLECKFIYIFNNDQNLKYERECYIQSVIAPIEKGQLFSMTLNFAKKTEYEIGGTD